MASFHRMNSSSSHLPSMLSALEEQNFLFQLQLRDQPEEESNEVRGEERGRNGEREGGIERGERDRETEWEKQGQCEISNKWS